MTGNFGDPMELERLATRPELFRWSANSSSPDEPRPSDQISQSSGPAGPSFAAGQFSLVRVPSADHEIHDLPRHIDELPHRLPGQARLDPIRG
jgi:hypothetical protein